MSLKLKIRTMFPALVSTTSPLTLLKVGLAYTFGLDVSALRTSLDPLYARISNNLSDLAFKYTAKDNISIHGADIASAGTVNLETATGDLVDVTGTTTITAITLSEGHERTVRFTGILTLTNGASLVLPSGANITTAAGDFAVFRGYAAGVVRAVDYVRASGFSLVGGTGNVVAANNGSEFTNPATFRSNLRIPISGYIYGLILSGAGFPYTSINISAGQAADATGIDVLSDSGNSKHITAAWTVGVSGGALDTGTFTAGNFYHMFVIKRPDTGVVDYAVSLSSVAPATGGNIPSAYTLSQWIGAFWAAAGPIYYDFYQINDNFYYRVGIQNVSAVAIGTSRLLVTTSAPPNKIALLRISGTNSGAPVSFLIQPTAETDRAPVPFPSMSSNVTAQPATGHFAIPVDGASQIAIRASVAASTISVETYGWVNR